MEDKAFLQGSTMEERAESLLESGLGNDCKFVVGDEKNKVVIDASKAFLVRASPVFERMFFGNLPATGPIEVPDIEPDVFQIMLRFIYGCKWTLDSNDQAVKLCYAANKYMIGELLTRCEEYLWPNDVENVWTALSVANLYSLDKLRIAALQIIEQNSYSVLRSPDIINISQSCLIEILRGSVLRVFHEIEVFRMCLQWAEAKCQEKGLPSNGFHLRSELGEALNLIRFLVMEPVEFAMEVVSTCILTNEESLTILRFLVTRGKTPSPTSLCQFRSSRIDDEHDFVSLNHYLDER